MSTSTNSLQVNSAIVSQRIRESPCLNLQKPVVTDPVPPSQAPPVKEEKKEEPKLASKEPEKKEEVHAGAGGGDKGKIVSEKKFPTFVVSDKLKLEEMKMFVDAHREHQEEK